MRIGYLWNGFLADIKLDKRGEEVSSPDGNATYSWCIEHECQRRGYKAIPLGEERDAPAIATLGKNAFLAYSQNYRSKSYERMAARGWNKRSDKTFPDLDLVLVEWRWPIPGRNTLDDRNKPGYSRDLERQGDVLRRYGERGTPIIVWDLDHKLTQTDLDMWGDAGISLRVIETSVVPRNGSTRVHPPTIVSELLQHPIDRRMPSHHLGYIGSRYERDDVIDEWIAPIAPPHTHRVKFWGKWEPRDELEARWPGVRFSGRIGVGGFREAYSRVAAVPLLAKRSYLECGFVTPRIAEAVIFGSIPVGLRSHKGIEEYVTRVAKDPADLYDAAVYYRTVSPIRRDVFREEAAHKLSHTDARSFVDVLETMTR